MHLNVWLGCLYLEHWQSLFPVIKLGLELGLALVLHIILDALDLVAVFSCNTNKMQSCVDCFAGEVLSLGVRIVCHFCYVMSLQKISSNEVQCGKAVVCWSKFQFYVCFNNFFLPLLNWFCNYWCSLGFDSFIGFKPCMHWNNVLSEVILYISKMSAEVWILIAYL